MTLEMSDFATLRRWLREAARPTAAILEGGYSEELPLLIDAFLSRGTNEADHRIEFPAFFPPSFRRCLHQK